ncbi:glucose 1-dehydrogenase [Acetobacter oeni]|uniref:Glucose-1-dehydrogenase n=1 Tax=Acetobacter oeni TaxID=304077 RepID=A0A511XIR4_9PROT|nr:glucose 1-dehydrogenase [Acetobacter oeni]MBB3881943.1 glucose 1-dehydrogenase [Acetobacter oeni]NHO17736.1 glucose 1-dehydrogenase [Acetobacter oeni]GBR06660.1 NAD/NADP-dependent glucose 1-dehydrogenase [Acetobacter oeni LMG 21952]GEN62836.1 glucose-1-dehydrogenase [Acetobacter oeni]
MTSTPSQRFAGKRVFVSGGSQGIGEAISLAFAREGARVAINGRKKEKLDALLPRLAKVAAGPHIACAGDVSDETAVTEAIDKAFQDLGGLDILVCNAGIQIKSPSEAISLADFEKVLSVNVTGVMLCVREVLKHWVRNGTKGNIVVDSSVHQIIPKPAFLGYSASKGAIGNMVRTWALEYASRGIRVNAVAPGAIVTPINDSWIHDPEKYKAVSEHIPMRRPGQPDEIAEPTLFLASDQASYITGQTLFIDGGMTLYADFEKNWAS